MREIVIECWRHFSSFLLTIISQVLSLSFLFITDLCMICWCSIQFCWYFWRNNCNSCIVETCIKSKKRKCFFLSQIFDPNFIWKSIYTWILHANRIALDTFTTHLLLLQTIHLRCCTAFLSCFPFGHFYIRTVAFKQNDCFWELGLSVKLCVLTLECKIRAKTPQWIEEWKCMWKKVIIKHNNTTV